MNDDVQPPDTPSDELVAVNAVLDGTASAAEQALVDASPELSALLESYRATSRELAVVDVASEAREAGIAAALAVFDQLDLAAVAAPAQTASNVVVLQRRRTWYRAVTGAAAALVLVVAGVAALSSLGDSSSNNESAATVPASQKSQEAGSTDAPAADDASSPMAATAAAGTMSPAASDAGSTQIESTGTADTTAPVPAENPSVSTIGSIGGAADPRTPVADQTALATYVANATARPAGAQQCAPNGGESLGEISYQGTPAIVIRDPATGGVTVHDAANCSVLTTLQP